jgi:hypothetical protein
VGELETQVSQEMRKRKGVEAKMMVLEKSEGVLRSRYAHIAYVAVLSPAQAHMTCIAMRLAVQTTHGTHRDDIGRTDKT